MIPVGLMSPTAQRNARVSGTSPDQGYWQGDRFVAPSYPLPKPSLMSPDVAKAVQAVKDNAEKAQALAVASSSIFGDGPQGEGIGAGKGGQQDQGATTGAPSGSAPAGTPNANVQDMMDQGIPGVQATVGQPGTMSPAPTPNVAEQQESGVMGHSQNNYGERGPASVGARGAPAPSMNPNDMAAPQAPAPATPPSQENDLGKAISGLFSGLARGINNAYGGLAATGLAGDPTSSETGPTSGNNEQGKTPSEAGPGPGGGAASGGMGMSGDTGTPAGNTGATNPGQDDTGGLGAGGLLRKGGFAGSDGDKSRKMKDEAMGTFGVPHVGTREVLG